MYPIECSGKFFVPSKLGQFDVVGMQATVDDITAVSRVVLIDDESYSIKPSTYDKKKGVIDVKGLPNQKGILEQVFPTPIRILKGISIVQTTNVVPGTVKVYVR